MINEVGFQISALLQLIQVILKLECARSFTCATTIFPLSFRG